MDIYLLRHGETDWNRRGLLQGHTDIPLNEKGKAQMLAVAEKLAGLGLKMDRIISSPLYRAHESAEIAAGRLGYPVENIIVEPMLIERGFGAGEGLTVEERTGKYPDNVYPGMESQEGLIRRGGQAFWKIVNAYPDAENLLLVAHGAILFALLEAVYEDWIVEGGKSAAFSQGSIYRIRYTEGRIGFAEYDEKEEGFLNADKAWIARNVKIYL